MNRSTCCLLLCVLLCVAVTSTVAADYLGSLREATTAIEVGAYNQAGSAIEQALAANESDPLVHLALATLYLHAGRVDDSAKEFREVIALDSDQWRAHYGLAVIALLKGDKGTAQKEISASRELTSSDPDVVALDLYRAYVSGGSATESDAATPLAKEIAAFAAVKAGQRQAVKDLLLEVLQAPAEPGFDENRSPVATFIAGTPISIPLGKLNWSPPKKENTPEVSGTVLLKADASSAEGVEFVSFYVDSSFVGMSNSEPYKFSWNTARQPNGVHQIRIDGKDSHGNVVSTKSTWVRVKNADAVASPNVSGPEVDDLTRRLWECIKLSESRRLAHYELAKAYLTDGERDAAVKQLEFAIAFQPDFGEARQMLERLEGKPSECREIRSGAPGRKRVAISYDDGPNQRTASLLDLLAELKIPATFFLVGFRAEAQPELVKAIAAAGHDVENHSYTHPNLATLSCYEVEQQLCKTNAIILSLTGKMPHYFRPPGGNFNGTVKKAAGKHSMNGIFWTLNCGPYEGGDPKAISDFVVQNIKDGAIILMHNGEPAEMGALPTIVEKLRAEGYQFVTVADLAFK